MSYLAGIIRSCKFGKSDLSFCHQDGISEKVSEMSLEEKAVEIKEDAPEEDEDEDAVDMEDFVESGMLEDDAATVDTNTNKVNINFLFF